jgi:hypothetical protein
MVKYELRTMRNEEVVAEFYAFFLSIITNNCLSLHGNNSNTLSDFLSCSEVNLNKCGIAFAHVTENCENDRIEINM